MEGSVEIAVVDDDQFYRFITTKQLVKAGITMNTITPFEDGRSAMDGLLQRDARNEPLPDAILLDLNMPILDGWGFMEEWQQHLADRYKYVRIYICTSSLDNEDVNRSREYTHVKDYIVKPIKAEVIERIVMEVLAF